MKQFCIVKFPSGHVYEFSVAAVINDRAKQWAALDQSRTIEQHRDAAEAALGNDFAMIDYIKESMTWGDIQSFARLVNYIPPTFKGVEWDDAELSFGDERAPAPTIEAMGSASVLAPVELAVSQALASDGGAVVLAFAQPVDQKITSAVIAVAGAEDAVQGYIAVVQQFNDFMMAGGAATH